jgi:AcrR family transcriptional regulator
MRRQQIFGGALECFEKKSYHETTLNDIAAAAGVSSGLIYQYFTDKRDLLFHVILEILDAYHRDLTTAVEGVADPLERLQRAALAYYKVINKRIPATLLAYRENKSLDRSQINSLKAKELQTNELLTDCLQQCKDKGYLEDIDPELATYWIVTTAHAWGLKNWRLRKIKSFEDYARATLRVLLHGMLNAKGRKHLATCELDASAV